MHNSIHNQARQGVHDLPKTATKTPELPAAIEECQKASDTLRQEVEELVNRLVPVTNIYPIAGNIEEKEESRHGLLEPLAQLRRSLDASVKSIRGVRSNLMV